MFTFKTILSPFVKLIPIFFILVFITFYLQWVRNSRKGLALFAICVLIIFITGFRPMTHYFMYNLEHTYDPLIDGSTKTEHIAVLGDWAGYDQTIPTISRLSQSSLPRLMEGIRLIERNQGNLIIFSGSGFKQPVSMAEMYAQAAETLGISRDLMILIDKPRDTNEEAIYLKKVIKDKRFILVTSARHMKRAMMIFESHGMNPVPAPVDYLVKRSGKKGFSYFIPCVDSLRISEAYMHEYLGILWFKLVLYIEEYQAKNETT